MYLSITIHGIDILIHSYYIYDVSTCVMQSIISFHTVMIEVLKMQSKFKYKYANNNTCS